MMKNLEQLRAKDALVAAGSIGTAKDGGRAVAKKVPAMIVANGFLGALAFAIESESKSDGYASVFKVIIHHLKNSGMMFSIDCADDNLNGFLDGLCAKDAATLRAVTDESMAYLNYLRRFAKPGKGDNE